MVKVSFPHPGNVHEPDAFTAWAGQGAVRLYERDDRNFAMLLERVQTSTLADVDADQVASVAGQLNRRLAIPAPPGMPRLQELADGWDQQLHPDPEELAHTLSPRALATAAATVHQLGRVQPDILIHGDLHP